MKQVKILYTSDEIHGAIKRLFSEPGAPDRRVALVAYVGGAGDSYLPHPKNLRLICNPSPGGTDPDTLRRMLEHRVNVEFSDKLHMKVYWSRDQGCIITSANASSSALGVNGLKEAGVYLPPGLVDIDKLIKYASPRDVHQSDWDKLDRRSREYERNVGGKREQKGKTPEFLEWFNSIHRKKWKIAWFGEEISGTAKAVKQMTFSEYGLKEPYTWGSVGKGRVRKTDWLLSFFLTNRGIKSVNWIYVDFIAEISPKEKRYYFREWPYHAVQAHTPSRYPLPPFRITAQFCKALGHAIKRYSREKLTQAKSNLPPVQLLNYISEEMECL